MLLAKPWPHILVAQHMLAGPQPQALLGRRGGTKLCKGHQVRRKGAAAQWQGTPTTQCSGDAAGQLGIVRWLVVE